MHLDRWLVQSYASLPSAPRGNPLNERTAMQHKVIRGD
jgi:hypothetical protein